MATLNYQSAIDAYTGELSQLQAAREFVNQGEALALLLDGEGAIGQNAPGQNQPPIARFLGPLLASRDFQQTLKGHRELRAMQETIDRSLQEINSLGKSSLTPGPRENSTPAPATPPNSATGPTPSQSPPPEETGLAEAQSQQQWSWRQGKPGVYPAPHIPKLPEIDSPARRVLKPFPERHASSPPQVSTYLREPPGSEVFGLPDSTIIKLPSSGEFFGRPASGAMRSASTDYWQLSLRKPGSIPVHCRWERPCASLRKPLAIPPADWPRSIHLITETELTRAWSSGLQYCGSVFLGCARESRTPLPSTKTTPGQ